jgi:hypothetical protein
MGFVRSAARRVAERVARLVAKNDLFEKPGERAPTTPLETPDPKASGPEDADGPEPTSAFVNAWASPGMFHKVWAQGPSRDPLTRAAGLISQRVGSPEVLKKNAKAQRPLFGRV